MQDFSCALTLKVAGLLYSVWNVPSLQDTPDATLTPQEVHSEQYAS